VEVRFALTAAATVTVRIVRDGRWVATPMISQALAAGEQRVVWDGTRSDGSLRDGTYTASVEVTDAVGTVSYGESFVADTAAPVLRMLPGRSVRIAVSEPATVRVWVNGRRFQREVTRAGVVLVRFAGEIRRARAVAWDAAGNRSPVVFRPPGSVSG
jgi:hypothetical protein